MGVRAILLLVHAHEYAIPPSGNIACSQNTLRGPKNYGAVPHREENKPSGKFRFIFLQTKDLDCLNFV